MGTLEVGCVCRSGNIRGPVGPIREVFFTGRAPPEPATEEEGRFHPTTSTPAAEGEEVAGEEDRRGEEKRERAEAGSRSIGAGSR